MIKGTIEYSIFDHGINNPEGRFSCNLFDEKIGGVYNCYGQTPQQAMIAALWHLQEISVVKKIESFYKK